MRNIELKEEIRIKGTAADVLDDFELFIERLERKCCDRFDVKVTAHAWNKSQREDRKTTEEKEDLQDQSLLI